MALVGTTLSLARSSESAASPSSSCSPTQKSKPSCTVTSKVESSLRMSCSRGLSAVTGSVLVTGWPCSAASAASTCAARSREASPLELPDWVPMSTDPSARCRPGHAIGSTVATTTSCGAPSGTKASATRTLAVAAGRISRTATQSVSPASPWNGRRSKGAAAGRERRSAPVSEPR